MECTDGESVEVELEVGEAVVVGIDFGAADGVVGSVRGGELGIAPGGVCLQDVYGECVVDSIAY